MVIRRWAMRLPRLQFCLTLAAAKLPIIAVLPFVIEGSSCLFHRRCCAWMVTGLLVAGASGVAEAAFENPAVYAAGSGRSADPRNRRLQCRHGAARATRRPPAPFEVDCGGVGGKGRWSDSKSWSYTLDRPLQPGERCDFRLKPNLKAADGDPMTGEPGYAFFAPGPWPRSIMPRPAVPSKRIRPS